MFYGLSRVLSFIDSLWSCTLRATGNGQWLHGETLTFFVPYNIIDLCLGTSYNGSMDVRPSLYLKAQITVHLLVATPTMTDGLISSGKYISGTSYYNTVSEWWCLFLIEVKHFFFPRSWLTSEWYFLLYWAQTSPNHLTGCVFEQCFVFYSYFFFFIFQ